MRLILPEEVMAERIPINPETLQENQEVAAVALDEQQLDPILEDAVASQPRVSAAEAPPEPGQPKSENQEPKPQTAKPRPIAGYAVALLSLGIVFAAAALGMKGGSSATPCATCGGGNPTPSTPTGTDPVIY
jgi:hypothetical protein